MVAQWVPVPKVESSILFALIFFFLPQRRCRTFGQDATGEIYVVSGADILKMVEA